MNRPDAHEVFEKVMAAETPAPTETATTQTPEPTPAAETTTQAPEPTPPDSISKRFQQLTEKELQVREQLEKVKSVESKTKEYEELMSLKDKDPLAFLEKTGLSLDILTKALLSDQKDLPEPEKKVKVLEEKLTQLEKLEQSRKEREIQIQVDKYVNELNTFIDTNQSKYKFIKATNSQPLVVQMISNYYKQNQEELDWETACKVVEEQLAETELNRVQRLMEIDVVKEKLKLKPDVVESPEPNKDAPLRNPVRTLSNSISATPSQKQESKLTREERRERALAIARESWKTN